MRYIFPILFAFIISICSAPLFAAELITLGEFSDAQKSDSEAVKLMHMFYIRGAADTHLLYGTILKDATGQEIFCVGDSVLGANELQALLNAKVVSLYREIGERSRKMPLVKAVELVVSAAYQCKKE